MHADAKEVERIVKSRLDKARRIIEASTKIAVTIVGETAARELLLNSAQQCQDDAEHNAAVRALYARSPR